MSNSSSESAGNIQKFRPYQSFHIERLGMMALQDGPPLFVVGVRSERWGYQGPMLKLIARYNPKTDEVSYAPSGIAKAEATRLLGTDGFLCLKIIADSTIGVPLTQAQPNKKEAKPKAKDNKEKVRPAPRRLLTVRGVSFSPAGIVIGLAVDESAKDYYDGYVDRLYDGLARSSMEWFRGWLPVYVPSKTKEDDQSEAGSRKKLQDPLARERPNLVSFLEQLAAKKRLADARRHTELLQRLKAQQEFYERTGGNIRGKRAPQSVAGNDGLTNPLSPTDGHGGNVERSETLPKPTS